MAVEGGGSASSLGHGGVGGTAVSIGFEGFEIVESCGQVSGVDGVGVVVCHRQSLVGGLGGVVWMTSLSCGLYGMYECRV